VQKIFLKLKWLILTKEKVKEGISNIMNVQKKEYDLKSLIALLQPREKLLSKTLPYKKKTLSIIEVFHR